jgi:hypothetical protein
VGAEEVGEDHEVVVVDEAVLAVDYRHHPHLRVVVPTGMILLLEDRVLGVIVPVIAVTPVLAWTTFETTRVKATTVKGVFTIVGAAADVVVAVEDSLAADVVTEVAA